MRSSGSTRSASRSRGRACCPEGRGRVNAGRARLLRPARRRAARARDRAVRDALPLGHAAGARGRGRLAGARDGRGVRRVHRGRRRAARRPRAPLDDAQRAVGLRVDRPRVGRARARAEERGRRGRGRAPPAALARLGRAGDPPREPRRAGRDHAQPRARLSGVRLARGRGGGVAGRRRREPLVPRPDLPRLVPGRPARAQRDRRAVRPRRRPRRRSRRRSTSSASTTTSASSSARAPRGRASCSDPEALRTDMGWEVYPDGLHALLTRVADGLRAAGDLRHGERRRVRRRPRARRPRPRPRADGVPRGAHRRGRARGRATACR